MNLALSNSILGKEVHVNQDDNKQHLENHVVHIREALRRGLGARNRMTLNNPLISGGQIFYSDTVRAVRELLKPFGYERESIRNVELTINKEHGIAIYLCSACDQTGNPAGVPQSSSDKGEFTLDLFSLQYDDAPNLDLFPELLPQVTTNNKLNCDVWFLLHFYDDKAKTVQAELARPISYDKKGFVTGFDQDSRIFIDIQDNEIVDIEPNFNSEIDFDIEELSSKDNV